MLIVGLFLCCTLFVAELAHYEISTEGGTNDTVQAYANVHPQCRELDSTYDLSCPIAGYNSVQMQCLTMTCIDRNPNLPPTTEAVRAAHIVMLQEDRLASLAVESPYNIDRHAFQQRKAQIMSPAEDAPPSVDINVKPGSMEEAAGIVQQRSSLLSRQIAHDWLKQHAN